MSDTLSIREQAAQIIEQRCEHAARELEDRLLRYVSSPQEHDLALPTLTPLILLKFAALRSSREEQHG